MIVSSICSARQTGQAAAHLRFEDLFRLAGFPFRQRFADADNGLERGGVGGVGFFGNQFVAFLLDTGGARNGRG